MATFKIKQISVPLFGFFELANKEPWYAAFSDKGETIQVEIDVDALDFIADELGLDAEDVSNAAARYVDGRFRQKAEGLSGGLLGEFGEVLVYLLIRAAPGKEIQRVVSWQAGANQPVKGNRFPQPDFIVRENGKHSALEVKSTEAFDYQDLLKVRKWKFLSPCSGVEVCRNRALEQLGYVGQKITPQLHALLTKQGWAVPFPVDSGTAVAVLVQDGRVKPLRTDGRFRAPKFCREVSPTRNCWNCIKQEDSVVVVSMPNSPEMLALGGYDDADSGRWFESYRRWTQALKSRELKAIEASLGEVSATIEKWANLQQGNDLGNVFRAFWSAYLADVVRSHGADLNPPLVGDLRELETPIDWNPAPIADYRLRESSGEDIRRLLRSGEPTLGWLSFRNEQNGESTESGCVNVTDSEVLFSFLGDSWWNKRNLDGMYDAEQLAIRSVSTVMWLSGWDEQEIDIPSIELRQVGVKVGERDVILGWSADSSNSSEQWYRRWWFLSKFGYLQWLPAVLVCGDSRVRFRVYPEGRVDLRIPRDLYDVHVRRK